MTKEVLVRVKGIQNLGEAIEPEETEIVANGNYYYKNGQHYLFFEEWMAGFPQPAKNSIRVQEKRVEVRKKGAAEVEMIFEENKKNLTWYATPFGNIEIGITAARVEVKEQETKLEISIDYALEMNAEYVADCQIFISAMEK